MLVSVATGLHLDSVNWLSRTRKEPAITIEVQYSGDSGQCDDDSVHN